MKKRGYIEDSEELRAAVADLKEKSSKNREASASEPEAKEEDTAEEAAVEEAVDDAGYDDEDPGYDEAEAEAPEDEAYRDDEDAEYYDEEYYEDEEAEAEAEEEYYDEEDEPQHRRLKPSETFEKTLRDTNPMSDVAKAVVESEKKSKEYRRQRKQEFEEAKSKPKRRDRKKKGSKADDAVICLEHVTKYYEHKPAPALNDVNIKIKKGEFVFIVGESGSGKSTLIRLLLRELKPSSGTVTVNGFQLDRMNRWKVPKLRRSMGVVFQDFRLLKDRNVYDNVAFAQRIVEASSREMKKNVPEILGKVGLASKYRAKTDELSGGEQQRVALARALVNKPSILLADEPTGNLDPKNTIEIMDLLEQINKEGTTVVVVTHNDKIVNDMHHRVITIKKGVVVSDREEGNYEDED